MVRSLEERKSNHLMMLDDLLTLFRNPENIWLFFDAKFANFDTYFHIDPEHLYSAGYQKTCDYLAICEGMECYLENKEYLEELQERISESDVEKLLEQIANRLKVKKEEDESIYTRFSRAVYFDEPILDIQNMYWEIEQDPDVSVSSLCSMAIEAKLYDRAIFYQHKIIHQTKNRRDCVSQLEELSKIYCLAGDYRNAYAIALRSTKVANRFQEWKDCGLESYLVERWLLISKGLAEQGHQALAKKSLLHGENMLESLAPHRKSLSIYEQVMQASEKLGLQKRYRHYQHIYQIKKERFDRRFS